METTKGDNKVILKGKETETVRQRSGRMIETIRGGGQGILKEAEAEIILPNPADWPTRGAVINKKVSGAEIETTAPAKAAATEAADLPIEVENLGIGVNLTK